MTSRTASGKPLAALLALALTLGGLAFAQPTSASTTITTSIPGVMLVDANLELDVMTTLGDTYKELEGRLTGDTLRVKLTSNHRWSLTITANGRQHTLIGDPGAYPDLDLGNITHLDLKPGDQVKLTLAARHAT